jgi:recombination protein RecT
MRLTASNPGVMTGPGTNSYIVGDAASGYIVIDPGPDDAQHRRRLLQATGGDIRLIVCTHSHPDHSPGARPLQALCERRPPILGLASRADVAAASSFTPDRELADGEVLSPVGRRPATACASSTRRAMPPTTCAWCWWRTACCSRATTS